MTEFIHSLIASSIATLIIQPLDVIRTQYQISYLNQKTNVFSLSRNIWKNQGIKGFYKGTTCHLLTYPLFWGIFFQTKKYQFQPTSHSVFDNICNSLIAGTLASTIVNPLFVLKTRKQSEIFRGSQNVNYSNLIANIARNEGIFGFYKGVNVTIFSNFKLGLQFPVYDFLMEKTNQSIFISSCFSKLLANSIFYPADIIRTQQRESTQKLSIRNIASLIYRKQGIIGFYKGMMLNNCTSGPNFLLLMLIKDYLGGDSPFIPPFLKK